MNIYFPKNKKSLLGIIVILLTVLIFLLPCCRKKDQPQQSRQAADSQETEQITESESTELSEPTEKIDLCILYAGVLESERAKDFTDLLSKHFTKIETTDYKSFTGNVPVDFDVAIIDYDGRDTRAQIPNIPRTYTRATITVGVPGAFICSRQSLKTGYL